MFYDNGINGRADTTAIKATTMTMAPRVTETAMSMFVKVATMKIMNVMTEAVTQAAVQ